MTGRPRNTVETFWKRIDMRGMGQCWLWRLSTKNGYGRYTENRVERYAHRTAYVLTWGDVPCGMQVMHTCNNKACCNPMHLTVGTPAQNTQDAYRDGLAKGHHKYPVELLERIRLDPRPQLELARVYGVSQSHISRIKNGKARTNGERNGAAA